MSPLEGKNLLPRGANSFFLEKKLFFTFLLKCNQIHLECTLKFQAAEDGRKRATALPPLEREPTFQRKPKHFNQYEGNVDEVCCVSTFPAMC